ncbi:MAG: UPF0182 family protein [Desulfohalobiaceae bacterium]|nr:UPF0182 family protein [Desulfohalobiaceae bacterium]
MYVVLLLLLLFAAFMLTLSGVKRNQRGRVLAGVILGLATVAFFAFLEFWGEYLWYDALGYSERFVTRIEALIGYTLLGGIVGWAAVWLLSRSYPRTWVSARKLAQLGGGAIGILWGLNAWRTIWIYANSVTTQVSDPIFAKDTGFYIFDLPFYNSLISLFVLLVLFTLAVAGAIWIDSSRGGGLEELLRTGRTARPLTAALPVGPVYLCAAALLVLIGVSTYLDRYEFMFSSTGVVTGAGWTDVNIRMPVYTLIALLCLILAAVLLIPAARNRLQGLMRRVPVQGVDPHLLGLGAVAVLLIVVWVSLVGILPTAFQQLRVEPNEITFERPYIQNNIEFTRQGFNLEKSEGRQFPAEERFDRQLVEDNEEIFNNIRLWDWRALGQVYKQFQELRLYYDFNDLDIDRYRYGDQYRQVMVAAREMNQDNLPEQSKTFVNRRFKYTHGYGIVMNNVSEFTEQGQPEFLIKDIPPQSTHPALNVERPEIYYGENTDTHVVVNSEEKEFDYPKGEENVNVRYQGDGGVGMGSLWRKFLYGWKFDGTTLFFSGYPKEGTRIMFDRQVLDRLNKLAPFLQYEPDPYIVLADGKLYWIVNAYTTTDRYPYSEVFSTRRAARQPGATSRPGQIFLPQETDYLEGPNYIRNSVKVAVNAYNGDTDFYVFDEEDPLLRVWRNIYPDLFTSRDKMPEELESHVRYPSDLLLLQGMVYSKYHMTDPDVFYNQEDLWVRATEKYYGRGQPVEPYYVMWERPQSDEAEFISMLPFTPKNRQVLIGWLAGMCDGENYGRLLAYQFPKDKRVLGPQQVEAKIDQNSYLSERLALWDQRGSRVIRGNVLAIPVDDTLLYVEPIYIEAESSAFPELRMVVVMQGENMSYATTFEKALEGLYSEDVEPEEMVEEAARETGAEMATVQELIKQANQAFESYLNLQQQMQFEEASRKMRKLRDTLQKLSEQAETREPESGGTTEEQSE